MLYRMEAGKIRTHAIEFAAAEHCNLRCSGCSHMSPFMSSRLATEDEFAQDFSRLATAMFADEVRIVGGEPTLNPRIGHILRAAKASGIAARVVMSTNGLLLHTMSQEFWENIDEIRLNLYPNARPTESLVEQSRKRAAENGVRLTVTEFSSFRVTMVTTPHPSDAITKMIFKTCKNAHLYHCHLVHAGWLYKCACPPYLNEFLQNMNESGYRMQNDGFDIHGARDLRKELWDFLTDTKPLDACRHCLGYAGIKQNHHQLSVSEARNAQSQPISRRTHLSKKTLARESMRYFGRRAKELLTGQREW